MGVQARLVLYAPGEAAARTAAGAAFDRLAALEDVMSDYRPTSELMRLCAQPPGTPVPVSDDLFAVLARAQELARLSDGAFDVTVGPIVRLWRAARKSGRLPEEAARREALAHTGWQHVRLDATARTVTLGLPGMQLDLGGIAKGYAIDEALAVLRQHGVERALLELGGDIRLGAAPPGEEGWPLQVAHADAVHRHQRLAHAAISSSGDTEQFVEIDGRRYSHVVDPKTGLGLTSRLAATVVAPDATTSDGLSTMLTVLGPERGLPLVASHFPGVTVYLRKVDEVR
jgi:thiamine biosynthesis lipoprotein